MNWHTVTVLLPYMLSCVISAGVAIYAWGRRKMPGAVAFGWVAFGEAFWTYGLIFELISPNLLGKIFWDSLEWLGAIPMVTALPLFVLEYLDIKIPHSKAIKVLLAIVPGTFILLVFTNPFHGLVYPDPFLAAGDPFTVLKYTFTPLIWAYSLYTYTIVIGCMLLLFNRLVQPNGLYRSQTIALALGVIIPIIGSMLTLAGVNFEPQRDITPYTFGIGNLIIAWALFHYHLFEMIPIARDSIIEHLPDPIVVVDGFDRVVDLNMAAQQSLKLNLSDAIGQPASEIFASWASLYQRLKNVQQTKFDIMIMDREGQEQALELEISPLYNRGGRFIGKVLMVRDITARKTLERDLRQLTEELETRVRQRTEELAQRTDELAEAYDTTLLGWARALELRDKETEGHSRRVMETTLILAQALNIPNQEIVHIRRGALLHDIGKMAIPDEILRKNGDLTDLEKQVVAQHPLTAYELLSPIPYLKKALEIPYCHHERWDGSGYPRGLKGKEIPLSARIFTIADVWDALRSDRPYRAAWSKEEAILYMQKQAGILFDPDVLGSFLDLVQHGEI